MSDFTITERTEPLTLKEVLDFVDDTNISKKDSHELKSRIVDVVHAERNKVIEEFASTLTNKDNMLEHDIDEVMTSFHSYDLACNYFREYVDYVAEQLRKEG